MSDRPWFPFYVDDWLASESVRAMSLAARGLYIECLRHAWTEGSIPADVTLLARVLGVSRREVATLWPQVAPKWQPAGEGRLTNARLEAERAKADAVSKRRAEAGKRGAQAKHGASNVVANADELPEQRSPQSHPQSQSQEPNPLVRPAPPSDPMAGFDRFKARYPRREKWPDAEAAWRSRKVQGAKHVDAILADLETRWLDQWRTAPQFVPLPASYLRGRRWEDERAPPNGRAAEADAAEEARLLDEEGGFVWQDGRRVGLKTRARQARAEAGEE